MKVASLACALFALAALAAVVKNGFQALLGFLMLLSVVCAVIFYRAHPQIEAKISGNTLDETNE